MVTNIDHAIAIPTKHRNVWEQISDISRNHIWQADCDQIAFLSTMRTGKGTRWRITTPGGKAYVAEITAWYEGLGYEYIIVDGMPFTKGKGRIRLQDAPEGTIVQWTFSYEIPGFFGNLRNALSVKRMIDNNIVDSLRNLYSYIKELKSDESFSSADSKALLRDAPDVEARLQYQPRHPSSSPDNQPVMVQETPSLIPELTIVEPPILEGDTKPNPAIVAPPLVENIAEPSFMRDVPIVEPVIAAPPAPEPVPAQIEKKPEPAVQPVLLPGSDQIDTGRMSVFEIFGLPKPSETEPVRTINPFDLLTEEEANRPIVPDILPDGRRRGLRAVLRERIAKTRIPLK
jgi:uncharacterized membrane protein